MAPGTVPPERRPGPPRRKRWRILSGMFLLASGLLGLLACAVVAGAIWARTDGGRAWLKDRLAALVAPAQGTLTIGALETDLYSEAVVHDVELVDAAGTRIGRVERLAVSYRLGGLLSRRLMVPTVRAEGVDLTLTRTDAGLDLPALWDDGSPPSGAPYRGVGIDIALPDIVVSDVTFAYRDGERTYGVEGARLAADVALVGPAVVVRGLHLDAPATTPALGRLAVAADARWDPNTLWVDGVDVRLGPNVLVAAGGLGQLGGAATVGLDLTTLHVDVDALAPLFPQGADGATRTLPVTGVFDATGGLAGLLRAPSLLLAVQTPGGPVSLNAGVDLRADRPTWTASVAPEAVDLSAFLPSVPAPTVVSGALSLDGAGFGWPDDLDVTAVFALTAPRVGTLASLAARGTATLADGVVEVPSFRVDAPGIGAGGTATVRILDETGEATLRDTSVELARLAGFGVPGGRGRVAFTGQARFGWAAVEGARGDVAAEGVVHGRDVGWGALADAGMVDGPVRASWSAARGADVVAGLALEGLSTPAAAGYRAETGRADLTLGVRPGGAVAVEGTAALGGVSGPEVAAESVAVEARVGRSARGRLDGAITLVTGPMVVANVASDHGAGRASFVGDDVAVVVDLYDGDRTVFAVDGEVDLTSLAVRARRLALAPTPDLAWRGEGVQTLRLVEGGVRDVNVRIVSDTSVLALQGGAQKHAAIDLTLDARDLRLDWLAAVWPERFAGYAGRVDARASMEGQAARPSLLFDVGARGLVVPGVVNSIDVDAQGVSTDGTLHLEGEVRAGGGALARVSADLPVSLALDAPGLRRDGDVAVQLDLPPCDDVAWAAVLPGVALQPFRASAQVRLSGPLRDPALGLVAAVQTPTGRRDEWLRFDLDGATTGGLFALRGVVRERLERRAQVDGTVDLHLGDIVRAALGEGPARDLKAPATWVGAVELDVVPLRLPLQALGTFVELPTALRGDLSGGLHVSGQARAPLVEGALFLSDGSLGDLPLSPALVAVGPADGGYQVDATLGFGAASALAVTGFVPFAPTLDTDLRAELAREGLALEVHGTDVPLAAVAAAWPTLSDASGTIRAEGVVTGSLVDPRPDVAFGLADGAFALSLTGVRYRDAQFSGRLTRDLLAVDGLSVTTIGGLTNETGTVTADFDAHRVGDRPALEGTITLDKAWIMDTPNQTVRADGKLRVANGADTVRVTGDVTVREARLIVPERFFTGTNDLALPSDVVVVRGRTTSTSGASRARGLALPAWLDLEVSVNLARNAFLDASLPMEQVLGQAFTSLSSIRVDTQLDGTVVAQVRGGALSLIGEVVPVRGTARVFGVPFQLAGETISFTGRDYTDPVLDLVATHDSGEFGNIITKITGTPSALQLAFSSDNPALAQDDLLSVLLFGRPASELDAADGSGATGLLTSVLTSSALALAKSQVGSAAARGFDVFEVGGTSLEIGRRFGQNVFVLAKYDWMSLNEKENAVEVTVELRVGRHWQFDLTSGSAPISSVGLSRKWRF